MIFEETKLAGALLVDIERREDERGFFARTWCADEFADHGLVNTFVQANVSWNAAKGTLRGMHFQHPPHAETKLVRCTRGAIYDVIVDLRGDSETFKQWLGVELTADNRRALFVPEGFAHGYQTLLPASEVIYQVSAAYAPAAEGGVRWDDPAFAIQWPERGDALLSDKDRSWPDFAG